MTLQKLKHFLRHDTPKSQRTNLNFRLKIKSYIQSWFRKDEFRPFVIQLFKSIGQFCMICTVCHRYGWLKEEFVPKEFDVIPNTV
jgi:hypothetical protein